MAGLLARWSCWPGASGLFLIGLGIWFQISCPGRLLTARAGLRASPGRHFGLSPAGTVAVSPSRWLGSGELALPGQAR